MPGVHDSRAFARSSYGDLTNGQNGVGRNYSYYYSRDSNQSSAGGGGRDAAAVGSNGGLMNGHHHDAYHSSNGLNGHASVHEIAVTRERRPSFPENHHISSSSTAHRSSSVVGNGFHRNGSVNGLASSGERHRDPEDTPSYWVEHLATFAVGRQFGLEWPADGIRKLKQMERSSAIWAQPMVLRLKQNVIQIEDENGELVEQFQLELVTEPTAHISTDPRDLYNNILLFVVREDRKTKTTSPTEMHIFQCSRISAHEVAEDIKLFLQGKHSIVRGGRRETEVSHSKSHSTAQERSTVSNGGGFGMRNGDTRMHNGSKEIPIVRSTGGGADVEFHPRYAPPGPSMYNSHGSSSEFMTSIAEHPFQPRYPRGIGNIQRSEGGSLSDSTEMFERDVNTLNRCFDEIERFVARIQQAALAQREIERRGGVLPIGKRRDPRIPAPGEGLLALRAQFPSEPEFVDILQKFKLCFNLLAKLKRHIREPNAPELLHFLFTPLTVILDASRWGLGENIGPRVIKPLITKDAKDLMLNCLTSKETEVWNSLGDAWKIPIEDWVKELPASYHPIFMDGYMPYGAPGDENRSTHRMSRHSSVNNIAMEREFDKLSIEKERLSLERERIAERERRLADEERRIEDERIRLATERQRLLDEQQDKVSERSSVLSSAGGGTPSSRHHNGPVANGDAFHRPAPLTNGGLNGSASVEQSPRHRAFLEDLQNRHAQIAQVTYDRLGQNAKELTVEKGEYLEILNDSKNWWECRNVGGRAGYVPKTILYVLTPRPGLQDPLFVNAAAASTSNSRNAFYDGPSTSSGTPSSFNSDIKTNGRLSPRANGMQVGADTPEYIQQRLGKKGQSVDRFDGRTEIATAIVHHQTGAIPKAPPPPNASAASVLSQVRLKPVAAGEVRKNEAALSNDAVLRNGNASHSNENNRLSNGSGSFQEELRRTVSKREFLNTKSKSNGVVRNLTERSTETEVADWLQQKAFSTRTREILEGQSGATLFSLAKEQLQEFCGKEEGSRIHSLLLVQKNISGYKTKSTAELKAILNARKDRVESPDSGSPGSSSLTNSESFSTATTSKLAGNSSIIFHGHSTQSNNVGEYNHTKPTHSSGNRPLLTQIFIGHEQNSSGADDKIKF